MPVPLPLITTSAVIQCSHLGTVTILPRPGRLVADFGTVLCEGDLVGATVVGCKTPISQSTKPCTAVISTAPGSTTPKMLVGVGLRPAYTSALQGVTDGVPPGQLVVISPGQTKLLA
jgi:hypothetical protein